LIKWLNREVQELHIEDQGGVGRDHTWDTLRAIGIVRWASDHRFLPFLHAKDALIPTSDDSPDPCHELERLSSVQT
jgi:hypothetical protein